MRRVLAAILVLIPLCLPGAAPGSQSQARPAGALELPEPLERNTALVQRYWEWLLAETGAPADLPWPRITVEDLPPNVRMGFFFPAPAAPQNVLRIAIAPRSLERARRGEELLVVGELAHELVHYVLLLAENGWDHRAEVLVNDVHHHCDPTFMRLSGEIGSMLFRAYNSPDTRRAVAHMVQVACWRDGHRMAGRPPLPGTDAR